MVHSITHTFWGPFESKNDGEESQDTDQNPDKTKAINNKTMEEKGNSSFEDNVKPVGTSPTDNFFNNEYRKMMEEVTVPTRRNTMNQKRQPHAAQRKMTWHKPTCQPTPDQPVRQRQARKWKLSGPSQRKKMMAHPANMKMKTNTAQRKKKSPAQSKKRILQKSV